MQSNPIRRGSSMLSLISSSPEKTSRDDHRPSVRASDLAGSHERTASCARSTDRGRRRAPRSQTAHPERAPALAASFDEPREVDNSEIALILRQALLDLVVSFHTIEQQVTAVPGDRLASNGTNRTNHS